MPGRTRPAAPGRSRLHPEEVAPVLPGGHRGDLLHRERQCRTGRPDSVSSPCWSERDVGDIALVDLQHDAVVIQRRDLEQQLALLDRGAQQLVQVARHDDAVERRGQVDAGQLVVDQGDLRVELRRSGPRSTIMLAAILPSPAPGVLAQRLLPLRRQPARSSSSSRSSSRASTCPACTMSPARTKLSAIWPSNGATAARWTAPSTHGLRRHAVSPLAKTEEHDHRDDHAARSASRRHGAARPATGPCPAPPRAPAATCRARLLRFRLEHRAEQPAGASCRILSFLRRIVRPTVRSSVITPIGCPSSSSGTDKTAHVFQFARQLGMGDGAEFLVRRVAGMTRAASRSSTSSIASPIRRTRLMRALNTAVCEIASTSTRPFVSKPMLTRSHFSRADSSLTTASAAAASLRLLHRGGDQVHRQAHPGDAGLAFLQRLLAEQVDQPGARPVQQPQSRAAAPGPDRARCPAPRRRAARRTPRSGSRYARAGRAPARKRRPPQRRFRAARSASVPPPALR